MDSFHIQKCSQRIPKKFTLVNFPITYIALRGRKTLSGLFTQKAERIFSKMIPLKIRIFSFYNNQLHFSDSMSLRVIPKVCSSAGLMPSSCRLGCANKDLDGYLGPLGKFIEYCRITALLPIIPLGIRNNWQLRYNSTMIYEFAQRPQRSIQILICTA